MAIRSVAIVGTGVIGASWASFFLARGLDVVATDPAAGAEARLRQDVARHWPALEALGIAEAASPDRLQFVPRVEDAVAEADWVQENGPEALSLKCDLFRTMDRIAPATTILASSSSTIGPGQFQQACDRHPERVVLGHPFNPPHLIPLVEVSGGLGAELAVAQAMAFYRSLGKRPIQLRKQTLGHVANRLQAALWQEAFHLVAEGVASVADIDAAIADGPGLRWALLGPFLNLHLSGGPGGIAALFDKPLWAATESIWRDLGRLTVTPALADRIAAELAEAMAGDAPEALIRDRDAALVDLLRRKAEAGALP